MTVLILIFAAFITAVGWHYSFDNAASGRLSPLENSDDNRRRVLMRRLSGAALLILGPLVYLGFHAVSPSRNPRWFIATWAAVLTLLVLVVALALLDLRLTHRMRREVLQRNRH